MIRKYKDEDLSFVQDNNLFVSLLIQYHNNVEKDNVFTLVDEDNNILGVLAMEYHNTWFSKHEDLNKILMNFAIKEDDENTKDILIDYAKTWCDNAKEKYKDKNICLTAWVQDTEYSEIEKYLMHGFTENKVASFLKFDLTKDIPNYYLPYGMTIDELKFNEEEVNEYIKCTEISNNGTKDSVNELWFMTGEPTYKIFVVRDKGRIVSSACVWKITKERTAVENIFTIPEYRRRNLARNVITHVLKVQKEKGYKLGTLGVWGDNKNAIKLYLSLGFRLYYNQIELHY